MQRWQGAEITFLLCVLNRLLQRSCEWWGVALSSNDTSQLFAVPTFSFPWRRQGRGLTFLSPSRVCKHHTPTFPNHRPTHPMRWEGTQIPPLPNKIIASQLRLPENQHSRHINKKHLAPGRGLTQHRQAVVDLWLGPRVTRAQLKAQLENTS